VFEHTDPAIRAIRAPFEEISATLGTRIDDATAEFDQKIAAQERYAAEVAEREAALRAQHAATPPPVPKRPAPKRPEPNDPSETGFYTATWMRNK
jgi:hypothetical protein